MWMQCYNESKEYLTIKAHDPSFFKLHKEIFVIWRKIGLWGFDFFDDNCLVVISKFTFCG